MKRGEREYDGDEPDVMVADIWGEKEGNESRDEE